MPILGFGEALKQRKEPVGVVGGRVRPRIEDVLAST
jgi:hypothetical protein